MKLFLTRHGQTDWNTKRCVCGRTEAQLTDLGRAQAAQVGEEAARAGVNVILASPMDRAQETAAIIAQKVGVPVLTEPLLIEQDFGTFEGRSVDDPEYREKRKSLLWHYPEGESTAQLIHRAYTVIEKVRDAGGIWHRPPDFDLLPGTAGVPVGGGSGGQRPAGDGGFGLLPALLL